MNKILKAFERLAKKENITITMLESRLGASKGVLTKAIANNSDIQSKWLIKLVETFPEYSLDWLINNEGEPEKLRVQNKKLLVKKMKDDAEEYAQQIRQLDIENKDLKEQIIQSHKQHLSQSQRIRELSEEVERYKKNSPSAV